MVIHIMEVHNQRGYEKPAIIAQYLAREKDYEWRNMRTDKSDESIHISLEGPDADRMTRIKSIASSQDGDIFKKYVRINDIMLNYSDKFEARCYGKKDERPRYRENTSNHAQVRRRPPNYNQFIDYQIDE